MQGAECIGMIIVYQLDCYYNFICVSED